VIQGDNDPTFNHRNADRLVETALGTNGHRSAHRTQITTGQVPAGRRYTRTAYTSTDAIPIWQASRPGQHPLDPNALATRTHTMVTGHWSRLAVGC
jgi:hypothetical protein